MADGTVSYRSGDRRLVPYSIDLPEGLTATVVGTPTFMLLEPGGVVQPAANVLAHDSGPANVLNGGTLVDLTSVPGGVYQGRFEVVISRSDGVHETLHPTVEIGVS